VRYSRDDTTAERGKNMTTATPIRQGRKIIGYTYREVAITRNEQYFEFLFERYDNRTTEVIERTIGAITAKIDELLDTKGGRTAGGKLVITTVVNGRVQSALTNPDWRHADARLTNQQAGE